MHPYPDIGFGLGLRNPHYDHILTHRPKVGWFEIISENFMDAHQGYRDFLSDLRRDYPIVMHGVSLSIGAVDPLNRDYVKKLKDLMDFLEPPWVSDHLCFTGFAGRNTHDLLPVPYTKEALAHISDRVMQVQDHLKRPLVLENPSSYLQFAADTMPEWEFIAALAARTGCGLLLDVNNVYVSAFNHGFDAKRYIDALPAEQIAQIHLAGHRPKGNYILDTHDAPVADPVWELYTYALKTKGFRSTMIEWDEQIPPFETMLAELQKAESHAAKVRLGMAA